MMRMGCMAGGGTRLVMLFVLKGHLALDAIVT